jgi:hypothetical protein
MPVVVAGAYPEKAIGCNDEGASKVERGFGRGKALGEIVS